MTTSKYSRSEEKGESRSSRGVLLPAAGSSRRPQSGTILMLTQYRLKELLHYDSDTGIFIWLAPTNRSMSVGTVAGTVRQDGYVRISVDGRRHFAHRLAWLYVHGEFPSHCIDHIDRVRANNRISNIRLATRAENQKNRNIQTNNTSGYKGVCWHKKAGKWIVFATLNGKQKYIGLFDAAEMASEAYQAFASQNHGEFYLRTTGGQT